MNTHRKTKTKTKTKTIAHKYEHIGNTTQHSKTLDTDLVGLVKVVSAENLDRIANIFVYVLAHLFPLQDKDRKKRQRQR